MFGPPPTALPDQQRKEFESAEILQPEAEYRPQRVNSSVLPCNAELQRLLSRRTAQEHVSALARRMVASGVEARAFCVRAPNWVPKGVLIAHLHEHKAAVTRLVAIRNTSYFASGSMDGSVKIWDCIKFEGRNVANRSRQTCTRLVIIGLMILFCILLMPNQFI
jgi:phosphoinositide-3-kinase regulatory subunit 4